MATEREMSPMAYSEFLRRVQSAAGYESATEAARAVTATLSALHHAVGSGGAAALPPEVRQLLPQGWDGTTTENPQMVGEWRAASGGESSRESGQ